MGISKLAVFGMFSLVYSGWLIASQPSNDAEKEMKRLDGVYVMVSGEAKGEKLAEKVVSSSTLTLEGTKYKVKLGDDKFSGIQKLNPTKTPKEIDATDSDGPNKGKTTLGIYKLEKDEFTVYFAPPGSARPNEFATKTGPGELLHVWKKK